MNKPAILSTRLNRDMKRALEGLAKAEKRSLSSLVENILADHLTERGIEWKCQERRSHPRKVIEMPGRLRIPGRRLSKEHEVSLKDISEAGAYTISRNVAGIEKILKKGGVSLKVQLILQLPNGKEPLVVDCQVVRISMDRNLAGIGLEYRKIRAKEQSAINESLLATV